METIQKDDELAGPSCSSQLHDDESPLYNFRKNRKKKLPFTIDEPPSEEPQKNKKITKRKNSSNNLNNHPLQIVDESVWLMPWPYVESYIISEMDRKSFKKVPKKVPSSLEVSDDTSDETNQKPFKKARVMYTSVEVFDDTSEELNKEPFKEVHMSSSAEVSDDTSNDKNDDDYDISRKKKSVEASSSKINLSSSDTSKRDFNYMSAHNHMERLRREELRALFTELYFIYSGTSGNKLPPKVRILEDSLNCIATLHEDIKSSRKLIEYFKARNNKLKSILNKQIVKTFTKKGPVPVKLFASTDM